MTTSTLLDRLLRNFLTSFRIVLFCRYKFANASKKMDHNVDATLGIGILNPYWSHAAFCRCTRTQTVCEDDAWMQQGSEKKIRLSNVNM